MSVPPSKRKPVSGTTQSDPSLLVNGEWVESGINITTNGSGVGVTDGRVYLTNGDVVNIGDSDISVDDPSVKNYIFIIQKSTSYQLGYNTDGSTPSEPHIKIAEVTPDVGEVISTNRGSPPTSLGNTDIENLNPEQIDNIVHVTETNDLPSPSNGTHTLEDSTVYHFAGFVTSDAGLEMGNVTPIRGSHASTDGFIHTGGSDAIVSNGEPYFQDSMTVHAPGGTIYNLSADNTTEMMVKDSAFSDAAGLGNIADLGVIDGFRVPSWVKCNFEDFDAGLVFDGTPDKIFIEASPIRGITASGVTVFTLAGTSSVAIVDFVNNYVKDVQSDTELWRVEDGGEPSEVFQYRGTTHDTSITKDNMLVGPNTSPTVEPYWVSDSYPLRDSSVVGELALDAGQTHTVTIDSVDTWYEVGGQTVTGNESERVSQVGNGTIEYVGSRDVNVHITVSASFSGGNGDLYQIALAKNGTVEDTSTMEFTASGTNSPISASISAIEDLDPNDEVSIQVKNTSTTNDATFEAYTITFLGA
jgi:hypothetical protein